MYNLIVFDLDGTLTASKQVIDKEMASLLCSLIKIKKVAIISGASFEQFKKQLIKDLPCSNLSNLYIFPANGSSMYRNDMNMWSMVYQDSLTDIEKEKINSVLEEVIEGLDEGEKYGDLIEDRESQITISLLGQEAPIEEKKGYDPSGVKRQKIVDKIKDKLPEFEIYIAGTTSIDITKKDINKAYGINRMMKYLEAEKQDILFIGDAIDNGNDSSVKKTGVDYRKVKNWKETEEVIKKLIEKSE